MRFSVFQYETIASTQSEAISIAQHNQSLENFWVVAQSQTSGRGRMGRLWENGVGNVYATLCLRHMHNYELRKALPFIAGLSVYNIIAPMLSDIQRMQLILKWPNDVLYSGAKLAGILIEVHSTGAQTDVCIGFGINTAFAPNIQGREISCLNDIGLKLSAQTMFEKLSAEFETLWYNYTRDLNFLQLLNSWQKNALPKGEILRVNTHDGIKIGAFFGLDITGALLIQLPNGKIETITAGDVDLY